jgi:hypothetical protein
MLRTVNGKTVNIPDVEIKSYMKSLGIDEEEAIEMWLDDEGYTENEEQMELEQKAKDSGIMRDIHGASAMDKTTKKSSKPKVVKVSDEKQMLFNEIRANLEDLFDNVEILKENKLIQVEINGKIFKIDLIEQRPKKK